MDEKATIASGAVPTHDPRKIESLRRGVRESEASWTTDGEELVRLLHDRDKCIAYLSSQSWCTEIRHVFLGYGIGNVVTLFLVEIAATPNVDQWLWCVVGDVPSAYLVVDETDGADDAMVVYSGLMEEWALSVLGSGKSLSEVYPVGAEPTHANADALLSRVKFIRETIVPNIRHTLNAS